MELLNSIIIDEPDDAIRETVERDERARLLDTISGTAPYSAFYLSTMLDDVERFQDSKHAAAYLGLAPSLYQSGDVSYTGHITKAGDPVLRSILIQCARAPIKSDERMKEFYLRIRRKRGGKEGYSCGGKEDGSLRILDSQEERNLQRAYPWLKLRGTSPGNEQGGHL